MNLIPPQISPKRLLARKLFDATVSSVPAIGGHLSAMYSVTHPSKIEFLTARWQGDITATVNDLEKKVDQFFETITISELAASIGYWMSKHSEFGMLDPIVDEKLELEFKDNSYAELDEACGELEHAGLATVSHFLGKGFRLRPTSELFVLFDPLVFDGIFPIEDAAQIARFTLEKSPNDGVSATEIMDKFGWNERRLNSAIRIILAMIADGRKSGEHYPNLECRYFYVDPKERAAIRHFLSTTAR
jgi:hypothetical protein